MARVDISDSQPDSFGLPRVTLLTMFRLGLFQAGLGIMSVLTQGVLNRVMIDELKVPALITTGTLAMAQFVAPARVWFGQMSDSKPILGHHRTGYVWIGTTLFAIAAFFAVQVVWQLGGTLPQWTTQTTAWVATLALVFAVYGLAISASGTPFAAMLVDVSDEDNRPKLVGIVWSMLMVGIIIGAIVSSRLLKEIELDTPIEILQVQINRLFLIMPAIVIGLCLLATVGVEKKYSRYGTRSSLADREDKVTLGVALRILTASRQTGIFFTFLLVMTISLFMQDGVLEPYGGRVFGMTIAETTKLNAFWGTGTLIGLSSTGFLLVPRLGKKNTTKVGCLAVAVCLILVVMAGTTASQALFKGVVVLFGIASGVTTTGALSLMLDLTAAETAGTFIGAWGLSQALARGLATAAGGAVLNLGEILFSTPLLAYGLVFVTQSVGMIVAVTLLSRVNVREFQTNAKQAIATLLENELDG
ncbi:MAG: BCD family MFS transporter [Nostocaceae cyanobacterium]|nr:BCD family MFS transporter [Nostocaceae cyanobacterium]